MRSLLVLLAACGAACGATTSASVDLSSFFDEERIEAARREAPDLLAQAERARDEAETAQANGDSDAAEDHATRARLLLEAAIVEAERSTMDRSRSDALREAEEATQGAVAADEERAAIEVELARARAAEVAETQIRAAFEQAAQDEPRRLRRRSEEVTAARRQAARALRDRARLLIAAARALGAEETSAQEIEASLASVDADPVAALQSMDDAHRRALALLGTARASHPVDAAARESLLQAARERGFEVELRAEGVVLALGRPNAARIEAAAAIVSAHPHGAVQVQGRGANGLRSRLQQAGVPTERLQASGGSDDPELVLTAYGAPR